MVVWVVFDGHRREFACALMAGVVSLAALAAPSRAAGRGGPRRHW
jgi:hypothetical protein